MPHRRTIADANFISQIFFLWLEPLVFLGWRKKSLDQDDLYDLPKEITSEHLHQRLERYWGEELARLSTGRQPRLVVALFKTIWKILLTSGLLFLTEWSIFVIQGVFVGLIAEYFTILDPTPSETRIVYIYAASISVLALIVGVVHSHVFFQTFRMSVHLRVAVTAAIFKKTLRLSPSTLARITCGHVINLISNDARRLDECLSMFHTVWVVPVILVVVGGLTWERVGPSALAGIGFICLGVVIQFTLTRVFAKLRAKAVLVTDNRVKVMNEVIAGIKAIKMYAWENAFQRLITKIRRKEVRILTLAGMIRGWQFALYFSTYIFSSYLTFSIYTALGNKITSAQLFTVITLFSLLTSLSLGYFMHGLLGIAELYVALRRIQRLLTLPELIPPSLTREFPPSLCEGVEREEEREEELRVTFKDVRIWNMGYSVPLLNNISFEANKHHRLVVVIGQVGAGKSTILTTILGEQQAVKGHVEVRGRVSYAGQEPWIFPGSVRDNILFGLPYQPDWYEQVVDACSLRRDIEDFPSGDLTLIGERGIGLSGGQKARVSLARAVYRNSDIYLLDDPLSAVDANVSKHIFTECVEGLLRDRLVILVTHQLHYAQEADKILILQEGEQRGFGSYRELQRSGVDVGDLLRLLQEEEEGNSPQGEAAGEVSSPTHLEVDPFLSPSPPFSTSVPSISQLSVYSTLSGTEPYYEGVKVADEDKAAGGITAMTYVRYFVAGGGYLLSVVTLCVFLFGELGIIFNDLWLAEWANVDSHNSSDCGEENETFSLIGRGLCPLETGQRIGVYSGLATTAAIILFTRLTLFFYVTQRASRQLHNRMLSAVMRAPMRFFETNPLGRILNRFSRDVGFMDDQVPFVFGEYLQLGIHILGMLAVPVSISPWLLLPSLFVIVSFIALRFYYLGGCREMKRLEAIARSPLYAHFSNSLQGLTTIRSCDMEGEVLSQYHFFQDENTKGWFLYLAFSRWFGVRIDLIGAIFITVVTFSCILLAGTTQAALVGLALTYMVSLTSVLQYTVRISADVENLMVSAERILTYTHLPPEAPLHTVPPSHPPPPSWPDKGGISLKRMSFSYDPTTPRVLKSISCVIYPGEKIGVVGRTGAGKSSLLCALFRLAEPDGLIDIDGVCTLDIGLHDLRKKLSIIPQEPVLFSGTLRYNLDPFQEQEESELWTALEQVELKPLVVGLKGRLECEVTEGGSNFSVGQRQLVCLARALLRKNKILVLDEATANVDMRTDAIIQRTLRDRFTGCTVITIAHRLNTVMDSDRIMVLDFGKLKEFGSPHRLLQSSSGLLSQLVEKVGAGEAARLRQTALEAHLNKRSREEEGGLEERGRGPEKENEETQVQLVLNGEAYPPSPSSHLPRSLSYNFATEFDSML